MPPGLSGFGSHFLGDFPSYSQSSLGWVIHEAAWPLAITKSHVQISDVNFLYILLAIRYNHSGNLFTLPILFVHSELLISDAYRELCILPFQFLYCQNFKVPTLHHSICVCCQGHWSGGSWGAVSGPAPKQLKAVWQEPHSCYGSFRTNLVPSQQSAGKWAGPSRWSSICHQPVSQMSSPVFNHCPPQMFLWLDLIRKYRANRDFFKP